MRIPTQQEIGKMRLKFPAGTRVVLIHMEGENVQSGMMGTVEFIDDAGQLQMRWDNGSRLALIPGVDKFRRATIDEVTASAEVRKNFRGSKLFFVNLLTF